LKSNHDRETPQSLLVTDLIRSALRLASKSNKHGNELVKHLGLTSARWQTLGELLFAVSPLTVSQLARQMGISRQAVQRLVNDMAKDHLVGFKENRSDLRADFVVISKIGRSTYLKAHDASQDFTNQLGAGFKTTELKSVLSIIDRMEMKFDELMIEAKD